MIYYKTLIALIIVNLKLWKSVDYTHKRMSLYWRPIIYNEKSTSFGVKVSERYQKEWKSCFSMSDYSIFITPPQFKSSLKTWKRRYNFLTVVVWSLIHCRLSCIILCRVFNPVFKLKVLNKTINIPVNKIKHR